MSTDGDQLLVEACVRAPTIAKACVILSDLLHLIKCKFKSVGLKALVPGVIKVFVRKNIGIELAVTELQKLWGP